jgi:hypothetical protein
VRKHVLAKYAHQDLLWGSDSAKDVYPYIAEGLGLHIVTDSPKRRRGSTTPGLPLSSTL